MPNQKSKKVFISHSSRDEAFVRKIVELLEDIGLTEDQVACSSIPGYGIPLGEDIYEWLAKQFREFDLHVLFVLSDNYYSSVACQNEMGATWVLKTKYDTILLPGFEYRDIKGAVNPNQISMKLDGNEEVLKQHLNELKDKLISEFVLTMPSASKWERHRQAFITAIASIPVQKDFDAGADDIAPMPENTTRLTPDAEKLLVEGANDPYGRIVVVKAMGGTFISANKTPFLNPEGGPRMEAKWMGALEELEDYGFIQAASYKREVFTITREGYAYADTLSAKGMDQLAPTKNDIESFL